MSDRLNDIVLHWQQKTADDTNVVQQLIPV